ANTADKAGPLHLLGHDPPAGAALQPQVHLCLGTELLQPAPHPGSTRLGDPAPPQLPTLGVAPLERDLRAMNIQPTYDRHGTSSGSWFQPSAHSRPPTSPALEQRGSPHMPCFACRPPLAEGARLARIRLSQDER